MTGEKSSFFTKKHIIIMIIALLLCIGIAVGILVVIQSVQPASPKDPVYGYLQITAGGGGRSSRRFCNLMRILRLPAILFR